MEELDADEAKVGQDLFDTMRKNSETTVADEGRPIRSMHAKPHCVLIGELEVADGLPEVLAQGHFAKPGRYPVVMRLSTLPGDILDDSVSTPRGLAVKIFDVQCERLPGSEGDVTQEFFATHSAVWDVQVQLCTDLKTTPVENVAKVWPEDESPYITVGRITVAAQPPWNEGRAKAVGRGVFIHRGTVWRRTVPSGQLCACARPPMRQVRTSEAAIAGRRSLNPGRSPFNTG